MDTFYILLTGSLTAIVCSIVGSYLVVRGFAMVTDALSHSIVPGIALAFLFTGSRDIVPMFLGATFFGLLSTYLIETLQKKVRVQADASIGVTFTWFFSIGILLISYFSGNIDLDLDCVLYGEIAFVPIDVLLINGVSYGPRALWIVGSTFLVVAMTLFTSRKEMRLALFDPSFAISVGILPVVWHYVLMTLVTLTTVASFEIVGSIIVVSLFIVLPASAYLLAKSLSSMILLSSLFGIVATFMGYYIAMYFNGSISGAISIATGAIFTVCFLLHIVKK
ncbi:MAG: metal ABC transporter permease [Candidatus Kapabacteria bacterium]|nr:metal ABC transporter permease [Candidatus Kapabacteria bacterium]